MMTLSASNYIKNKNKRIKGNKILSPRGIKLSIVWLSGYKIEF